MSESAAQAYAMLNAMMDVQKRSVATMDRLASKVHEVVVEMERVARGQTQVRAEFAELRSEFSAFRADTAARFETVGARFAAVGARFDDVERGIDRTLHELQEARSEIVSQNMQTLNAVQEALNVRIQVDELAERVQALEAKT